VKTLQCQDTLILVAWHHVSSYLIVVALQLPPLLESGPPVLEVVSPAFHRCPWGARTATFTVPFPFTRSPALGLAYKYHCSGKWNPSSFIIPPWRTVVAEGAWLPSCTMGALVCWLEAGNQSFHVGIVLSFGMRTTVVVALHP
jgi:hypothetical protein